MIEATAAETHSTGVLGAKGMPTTLLAFASIWGVGFASQALSPFFVGNLVQNLGYSHTLAGLIQSAELLAAAITSLIISPWISGISKRRLALGGAVMACCMDAASSVTSASEILCLLRVLSGIGAGLCLASGNALIAAHPEPERLYARVFMITATVYCSVFLLVGHLAEAFGSHGAYGFEAVWALIMVPILWCMPIMVSSKGDRVDDWSNVPVIPTALMLVAFVLFETCDVGVWAFSERVANSVGIKMSDSGWTLAGSSAIALGAAFIVSRIGCRFGQAWPVVLSLVCFGSTCFLILTAVNVQLFTTAILAYQGTYAFALPYLYGTAGAIDPKGRVIVASSGAALIGASIGPYVVGKLSEHTGFASTGWLTLMILVAVAGLLLITLRHVSSGRGNR